MSSFKLQIFIQKISRATKSIMFFFKLKTNITYPTFFSSKNTKLLLLLLLLFGFFTSALDSKSLQVFRTLLSILTVLNNAVVWMVSIRPPTSKLSSPFSNPLVTVPNAPIKTGIIVTFLFHSFFNSLAKFRYLSFFSLSFSFILWSAGTAKSFFLFITIRSGRCSWCNGYRRRKFTRRHEFKSWTRLIAFHIALIPLAKVWSQLFSLQLWVNSKAG